jgi:hypothetical protein
MVSEVASGRETRESICHGGDNVIHHVTMDGGCKIGGNGTERISLDKPVIMILKTTIDVVGP